MSKFPNNDYIRKTYHYNKKEYKNTLKKREKEEKERQLTKLENLGNKNATEKWKIIKSFIGDDNTRNKDPSENIPQDTFVNFFKDLWYDENIDKNEFPNSVIKPLTHLSEENKNEMRKT